MRARTMRSLVRGLAAALVLGTATGGCAGLVGIGDSASPSSTSTASRPPSSPTARPVDGAQAQRLQRVMTPLIKAMDHPLPLDQVKIGIMDDPHINAASGGGGEFYVTRGLLEKANDRHLAGVLAHELAHDDLRHVAKMSPTIMAETLTWLMQTEGSSSGGFFSTHPATNDRIEALRRPR